MRTNRATCVSSRGVGICAPCRASSTALYPGQRTRSIARHGTTQPTQLCPTSSTNTSLSSPDVTRRSDEVQNRLKIVDFTTNSTRPSSRPRRVKQPAVKSRASSSDALFAPYVTAECPGTRATSQACARRHETPHISPNTGRPAFKLTQRRPRTDSVRTHRTRSRSAEVDKIAFHCDFTASRNARILPASSRSQHPCERSKCTRRSRGTYRFSVAYGEFEKPTSWRPLLCVRLRSGDYGSAGLGPSWAVDAGTQQVSHASEVRWDAGSRRSGRGGGTESRTSETAHSGRPYPACRTQATHVSSQAGLRRSRVEHTTQPPSGATRSRRRPTTFPPAYTGRPRCAARRTRRTASCPWLPRQRVGKAPQERPRRGQTRTARTRESRSGRCVDGSRRARYVPARVLDHC
ncbi:hypothetical protein K466DRAFT_7388 [Polyporus arcularius HHB13444]|uniref:Uncharacterized protein n=1 Tax=Polyporus arcularius HHB13444 TaxID=1314778 RepID=A0A5C3NSF6_9APHY|nr:hypothetical protein K466DRAFT_7388 [Polyporus arcularius HHB13444]